MSDSIEFKLPDVGEGIAEAEVIEWLVAVGEEVAEDQPLVVIETDKSQLELPAPGAGTIVALRASEGDVVKVGEDLVEISTAGSAPTSSATEGTASSASGADAAAAHRPSSNILSVGRVATSDVSEATTPAPSAAPRGLRPLASPSTRRLALQLRVDLTRVQGTGPNGRILAEDLNGTGSAGGAAAASATAGRETAGAGAGTDVGLDKALDAPLAESGSVAAGPTDADPVSAQTRGSRPARPERPQDTTVIELRGLRRQIARSMTEALRIPHATEFREIDATALLEARAALRPRFEEAGLRLSILPFLVKACTWALARRPSLNARFDAENERITQYRAVHLGIATATDDGLIVPVLRNSDDMSLREIASHIDRLARLARTRTATSEELGDGTFTLTNFGSYGTWLGTPIIRPPEVAIAGFGRVEQKVIPVDGAPAVRPVLPIVVAADHRINDGAHLGGLVSDIGSALTQPLLLLDIV